MEYFTKKRLITLLIIFLILINVSAIVTIVIQNKSHKSFFRKDKGDRHDPLDFLKSELNLDDNQYSQFKQLFEEHKKLISQNMEKVKEIRTKLMDVIMSNSSDTNEINRLASEIGASQTELEKMNAAHLSKVKSICNAEQQTKLAQIFKEMPSMKKFRYDPDRKHPDGSEKDKP